MITSSYQKITNHAGESISIIASTMSVIFGIVGAFAVINKCHLKRRRYLRAAEIKQQGHMSTAIIFSVIEGSWDGEPVLQASNDMEFELSCCNDRVFHEKKKRDVTETKVTQVLWHKMM